MRKLTVKFVIDGADKEKTKRDEKSWFIASGKMPFFQRILILLTGRIFIRIINHECLIHRDREEIKNL